MAVFSYMPLYVSDYMADTSHLTLEEHGAYLLLIMNYWQRGEGLPDNDKQLALIVHTSLKKWYSVREQVISFFYIRDGKLVNNRIEAELGKLRSKSDKAKASINKRWDTNVLPTYNEGITSRAEDNDNDKLTTESSNKIPTVSVDSENKNLSLVVTDSNKKDSFSETRKKASRSASEPSITKETWDAYEKAYDELYHVPPLRNASVNSMMVKVVKNIGTEDSPGVAAFYLTHRHSFYVSNGHSINLLLRDCSKLHTEWLTKTKIHARDASEADRISSNNSMYDRIGANYEAMKAERQKNELSTSNL